jgi:ribonucleoside-diphosphate reductase alpha chain
MAPQTKITKESLPAERFSVTRKVIIAGKIFYITLGEYADGRLGEVFVSVDKEGSRLRIYDTWAITFSIGLQYGIPLSAFSDKLMYQRFEPAGITNSKDIPIAMSVIDYLFKWLEIRYDEQGQRRVTNENNLTKPITNDTIDDNPGDE